MDGAGVACSGRLFAHVGWRGFLRRALEPLGPEVWNVKALLKSAWKFIQDESGPTAVEYAFMLALIIVVCITAIRSVGTSTSTVFSQAGDGLPTGS